MNYNKLGGNSNKKYAHSITFDVAYGGYVSLGTIINDISHKMSESEITDFLYNSEFVSFFKPFIANGYIESGDKYVLGVYADKTSSSYKLALIISSSGGGYGPYSDFTILNIYDHIVEV